VKPTQEIIIHAGQTPPPEIVAVLNATYAEEEVADALRQGAKLKLSLVTPWPKPKIKKPDPTISPELILELKSLSPDADRLEKRIEDLSGPQILKIGKMLGIPMAQSAKTTGLRARLFGSLRSESVWKAISGQDDEREDLKNLNDPPPSEKEVSTP
jgi:hypothetical protein